MTYGMILTTCESEEEARALAGKLVLERLAACVQIHEVTSIYRWEENIHTDPEFRLVIKTKASLYEKVEAFIKKHHGYEVPQIVQVPMDGGSADYLGWIDKNTR